VTADPDAAAVPDLDDLYAARFPPGEAARRSAIWIELTRYLARFIPPESTVLDLACDRGDFINHVVARERWAVDVRDVRSELQPGVSFVQSDGLAIGSRFAAETFDVVFMSNYLEHLASAEVVVDQLRAVAQVLKPGGQAIILQPNIRLVGGAYWDFLDHRTALTERSLEEAGSLAGLETAKLITRFLPYTTKSKMPQHPLLVRAYLAIPLAWRLLGRQTLYVGRRPAR
jgi:2-polyprenyl-3-methyl-5-hydroxy-6-metoxy-1,4-benzoquinol methylase